MDEQLQQASITPNKNHKSITVLAGFVVLLIAILGVTSLTNNTANKNAAETVAMIRITDHGFEPATLAVKTGTKIMWVNAGNSLHQVASNPYPRGGDLSNLKSVILSDNQNYTYIASTAGSFNYHDQMNPTINGTLVVQKK